jgi:glycogen debranching enzyme
MVDALQQAMSALSAGIYEQEAVEVLDRISDEFTKPIQQLYEQQREAAEPFAAKNYNFNFYTVFGKKLMDYADNLARQSSISLGPSAFGELDFFNRRLSEDLYDLYLAGQDKAIDPNYLDVNELEQTLQVKN